MANSKHKLVNLFNIIDLPSLSTKAAFNNAKNQTLVIYVNLHANKLDIIKAVSLYFGIKAIDVRTVIVKGKQKRSMIKRGVSYTAPDRKKAYVKVSKESFDILSRKNIGGSEVVAPGEIKKENNVDFSSVSA